MNSPNALSWPRYKSWFHVPLTMFLVLLPFAAHQLYRVDWAVAAIFLTYVLLAAVLRSRVVGYFLAGLSVRLLSPQLDSTQPDPTVIMGGVFGLIAGFIADVIGNPPILTPTQPGARKGPPLPPGRIGG